MPSIDCHEFFATGSRVLTDLVELRVNNPAPEHCTPAANVTNLASAILDNVEPQQVRANPSVQNMCLALAVAVERFVALEESGLIT